MKKIKIFGIGTALLLILVVIGSPVTSNIDQLVKTDITEETEYMLLESSPDDSLSDCPCKNPDRPTVNIDRPTVVPDFQMRDDIIYRGSALDEPGECNLPGDTNYDFIVDIQDFLLVLAQWGTSGPEGDVNDDGTVDIQDFLMILAHWGETIDPVDCMMSIQVDLSERIFGISDPNLMYPLLLEEPVSNGPGEYIGTNGQGDFFVFEAQFYENEGWEDIEIEPGVIMTDTALVTGIINGIDVVALTGTIVTQGGIASETEDNFLVLVDDTPQWPPASPYEGPDPIIPDDHGDWVDPDGYDCGCPEEDLDPCPYLSTLCPNGGEYNPFCDASLCSRTCDIENEFLRCMARARKWMNVAFAFLLATIIQFLFCATAPPPINMLACYSILGPGAAAMGAAMLAFREAVQDCLDKRQNDLQNLFNDHCNDGP